MADLALNAHLFESKQITLAVIGSGDPENFTQLRKITQYEGLLFSDPSLASFSILGFSNGLAGVMNPGSLFKAVSAFRKGHRQGSIQGSPMQLGGAVVINSAGIVRFYFAASKAGEHPEIYDLLAAAEESRSFI